MFTLTQDTFNGCHNLSLSAEAYTDLGNSSSSVVNVSFPKGMYSVPVSGANNEKGRQKFPLSFSFFLILCLFIML